MNIKLAGLCVRVETPYRELVSFYQPYRCQEDPDFTIVVSPDDFQKESLLSPQALDWEVFGLATYRKLSIQALDYNCILFHSSAIAVNGRGYLFSAPSGTGKSTHSLLWKEILDKRLSVVNDDKPLLRLINGTWFVCGSPWKGKHNLGNDQQVPIQGICFLKQSNENRIFKINKTTAIPLVLNQVLRPRDIEKMDKLLELIDNLLNEVPMWQLYCLPNQAAASLCYNTMKGSLNNEI